MTLQRYSGSARAIVPTVSDRRGRATFYAQQLDLRSEWDEPFTKDRFTGHGSAGHCDANFIAGRAADCEEKIWEYSLESR